MEWANADGTAYRQRLPGFDVPGRRDNFQGFRAPVPRRRFPVNDARPYGNGPQMPTPSRRPVTFRTVVHSDDVDDLPPMARETGETHEASSNQRIMLESFLSSQDLRTARANGTNRRKKTTNKRAANKGQPSLLRRKVLKPGMNRSLMAPNERDEEEESSEEEEEDDDDDNDDDSDPSSDGTMTQGLHRRRPAGSASQNGRVRQVLARKGAARLRAQQNAAHAQPPPTPSPSPSPSPSPPPMWRINTARKAKSARRDHIERPGEVDRGTSESDMGESNRTPSTSLDEDTTDAGAQMALDENETDTPEQTPASSEEEKEEEKEQKSAEPADTRRKSRAVHIMSLKRLRAQVPEIEETSSNPLERAAQLQSYVSHRAMDFEHRRFLPRNLRRGFNIHHSDLAPSSLTPHDVPSGIWRIEYHAAGQVLTPDMMNLEMWGWRCPLCEFHGDFGNRERVARHIESDHRDCAVDWAVGHIEGWVWRAKITFVKQEEGGSVQEWVNLFILRKREEYPVFQAPSVPVTPRPVPLNLIQEASPQKYRTPTAATSSRETSTASRSTLSRTPSATPSVKQEDDDGTPVPRSLTPEIVYPVSPGRRFRVETPELASDWAETPPTASRYGYRKPRPENTLPGILDPTQRDAPIEIYTIASSTLNGEGKEPVAKAPFLGYISQDGNRILQHSAWPSGPRIFNLLHLLDTKKDFGVLAWTVLWKEDSIFEEPMHDHDKVVACLWCRWIFLNKNRLQFIADPVKGVKLWLDEYHWMIGLAAGKDALWNWLWVLTKIKMLDAINHKQLLEYYLKEVAICEYRRKILRPIGEAVITI